MAPVLLLHKFCKFSSLYDLPMKDNTVSEISSGLERPNFPQFSFSILEKTQFLHITSPNVKLEYLPLHPLSFSSPFHIPVFLLYTL